MQPPLSAGQRPVRNLLLAAKPCDPPDARVVPAASVVAFVRDYLVYAMRIAEPDDCAEFVEMADWLGTRDGIRVVSLGAYLGADAAHPVACHAIADSRDDGFAEAMRVYAKSFTNPATKVGIEEFRALVDGSTDRAPCRYHLWSLEIPGTRAAAGMASFFSLPSAGFGGYIALIPPLRGSGALPAVIARIEQQFIGDSASTVGWYIECAEERTAALFVAQGFSEIAVTYRQPPLRGEPLHGEGAAPLHLLYKEFGARYAPPVLSSADFTGALRDIWCFVYGIARPHDHPIYQTLATQAQAWNSVPFIVPNRAPGMHAGPDCSDRSRANAALRAARGNPE